MPVNNDAATAVRLAREWGVHLTGTAKARALSIPRGTPAEAHKAILANARAVARALLAPPAPAPVEPTPAAAEARAQPVDAPVEPTPEPDDPEPFGSLRPGPCPGCGALTLAVTGLGFCDGCGWVKLPAPIAGPATRAPRAWAPAADDPLPPSKVPFHARPEVLADPARCRGCGARAVVAGQCQRCGCMAPRGLELVEAAS